jgi:hypothetical protein
MKMEFLAKPWPSLHFVWEGIFPVLIWTQDGESSMSYRSHIIPGGKEPWYYRIGGGAVKEDFSLSLVI